MNRLLTFLTMFIVACNFLSAQELAANDDEVVTLNPFSQMQSRPGEVIVKFRSECGVRKMPRGKFRSTGNSALDIVLHEIGAAEIEPLMPLIDALATASNGGNKAKSIRTYTGQEVMLQDMTTLYSISYDVNQYPDINEVIAKLHECSDVEYAEPNYIVYALSEGDTETYTKEPMYSQQWGLERIGIKTLWEKPRVRDRKTIVAILDTGVDTTHPDLAANIWTNEDEQETGADNDNNGYVDDLHGWDFVNNTPNVRDNNGHGTHCAGIAAAVGNNGIGITGANPDALIMPVTVLQSNGQGDIATIIKGIDYAAANGADIISMSFGTTAYSVAQEQALAKAYQKSVLVAAAGNDGHDIQFEGHHTIGDQICYSCSPVYPAALNYVIGVMASQEGINESHCWYKDSYIADYSNWDCNGPITSQYSEEQLYNYEIMAPGSHILSTFPNGKYKYLSGTSMACPLVAGAISRLMDCRETATKEILLSDLIQTSKGNLTGVLDIDAAASLNDKTRITRLTAISLGMDDSEGDNDGRYDAGEIISFTPTIRCLSGKAENIKVWLEMDGEEDASMVTFITNNVDFVWPLSTYAKDKSCNPLKFKIADDCADGRIVKLALCMQSDNMTEPIKEQVLLNVENGVELYGVLNEDMTLYPDVHYIVTADFGIPKGRTLTILPGTVLKFKGDAIMVGRECTIIAEGTPEKMITFDLSEFSGYGFIDQRWSDTSFKYIRFINGNCVLSMPLENCIIEGFNNGTINGFLENCNIVSSIIQKISLSGNNNNVVNNKLRSSTYPPSYQEGMDILSLNSSNVFNNYYQNTEVNISYYSNTASVAQVDNLYLGSSNETRINNTIVDVDNKFYSNGYGRVDISNVALRPSFEAHGIVWKVLVNGYDARDEFNLLPPLGVGKHKFEVYYNRPVDTSFKPTISMGVRSPYTQTSIAEDGSWNEPGDVYTAYLTISGYKGQEGLNRISVAGGQDLEHFDIPIENSRFNVMVQKSGTLSTGIEAESKLGYIAVKWQEPNEEDDMLLGYNLCRYILSNDGVAGDTVAINKGLLDKTETSFIDDDVKSGVNYNYYLSQLNTDLSNVTVTNTVSVTSLTAVLGDANGSGSVDVADIVTDIAQMTGQNPKPFIFDAADINKDKRINILDVVGTILVIQSGGGASSLSLQDDTPIEYTIEDGILYANHCQQLAGLQLTLYNDGNYQVTPLESLNGFEIVKYSLSAETSSFIIYSMSGKVLEPGKQPLFYVGSNTTIEDIIASDCSGRSISGNQNELMPVESVLCDTPATLISEIVVTDLSGRKVCTAPYKHQSVEPTLEAIGLKTGTYIVSFCDAEGKILLVNKYLVK